MTVPREHAAQAPLEGSDDLASLGLALEPLKDLFGLPESSLVSASLVCGGALLLFLVGLYDLARPRAGSAA